MTAPAAITYSHATWVAQFPEFAAVTDAMGQNYFTRATFLCQNNAQNPTAGTPGMLESLLYLLTSHIAWLNAPRDAAGNPAATGSPPPPIVGRIDQASEGSVSVHAEMGDANDGSPSQAWYMQTRYGAEYWAATAGVRTFRYAAPAAGGVLVPGVNYALLSRGRGGVY